MPMRYWFDTEFHDHGRHIDLISIGVVAEDGREYYAVNAEYRWSRANRFLRDHVRPHLGSGPFLPRRRMRHELDAFLSSGGPPTEFWADHGEYDWIVLRQLWGELIRWPSGWPITCMDVEQWRLMLRAGPFPAAPSVPHNALSDARSVRERWRWLYSGAPQGIE